ncbi:MAG: hypothetical protein ACTSUF_09670 [Candidatus Heimdallarchaeaceae archaeon]
MSIATKVQFTFRTDASIDKVAQKIKSGDIVFLNKSKSIVINQFQGRGNIIKRRVK